MDGQTRRILPLGAGTFAVGTGMLVAQGVLPEIARDLGVTESAAGQVVTAFAVVYALGAPLLAVAAARFEPRRLLAGALLAFALANAAGAFAASLGALLAARALAALASALYTPNATVTGAGLVPETQRGRAIALVYGGLSVATVLGVPAGTLIGGAAGWRAAFVFVAVLGVLAAVGIVAATPATRPPPAAGLAVLLAVGRRPAVRSTAGVTTAMMTAQFVVFTFIAPYVEEVTGVSGGGILAGALFLFGAAAVVGNAAGGLATDRIGARRTVLLCQAGFVAALLLLWLARSLPPSPGSIALGAVAVVGWGITGYGFAPAQQQRLLRAAPDAGGVALSLNASALYAGIALGGLLGAAAIDAGLLGGLPLIGAGLGLGTLLLAFATAQETAPVVAAPSLLARGPVGPPADCVAGWGALPARRRPSGPEGPDEPDPHRLTRIEDQRDPRIGDGAATSCPRSLAANRCGEPTHPSRHRSPI
jgi:predicted MFS family arabinose efflux permease